MFVRRAMIWTAALMVLLLAACNLPVKTPPPTLTIDDIRLTAAAATIAAHQTEAAVGSPQQTAPPNAASGVNSTPIPTFTPLATGTEDTRQCESAAFVADVSIPDGTKLTPGETFTKTWRLVNNGNCNWTTDFELVYVSGDKMSGPNSKAATVDVIAPGGYLEVSVQLTAPTRAGDYTGYWNLRNASDVVFTSPTFWVQIEVLQATETPSPTTRTVSLSPVNEGFVRSDGVVGEHAYAGDTEGNNGLQAFMQFDTSMIPPGAIINDVTVHFGNFTSLGRPFNAFDCLRAYPGIFFPLDSSDYFNGEPSGAIIRWCSPDDLSGSFSDPDVREALRTIQSDDTDNLFELRIQFNALATNDDDTADQIQFGTVTLKINYTAYPEP